MEAQDGLASVLVRLAEAGADRFDPARFAYIAALARRSAQKHGPVRQRLEEKALAAVDAYQTVFAAAHQAAASQVSRLAEEHPEAVGRIRERFQQGDFRGVERSAARLARVGQRSALAGLTERIVRAGRLAGEEAARFSLDALLQRQEEAIVAAHDPEADEQTPAMPDARLRAFSLFAKSWAAQRADALVTQAVAHVPENPGHLNSQMLVTRCLAAMRQRSPAYLQRWVGYMETLLWLEGAGRESAARTVKVRRR